MPKVFTSKTQKVGETGENIAVRFLVKQDFLIIERNYTKKWGEIDIIAEKEGKLHFVEVKSVSKPNLDIVTPASTRSNPASPNRGELGGRDTLDQYHPEDNMHPWKLKRLSRTIQTYLLSRNVPEDKDWQVDLIVIFLDMDHKKARIKLVSDIIL